MYLLELPRILGRFTYWYINLMLCHGKRGLNAKFQFLPISFSFCKSFMQLHGYVVYQKFQHVRMDFSSLHSVMEKGGFFEKF